MGRQPTRLPGQSGMHLDRVEVTQDLCYSCLTAPEDEEQRLSHTFEIMSLLGLSAGVSWMFVLFLGTGFGTSLRLGQVLCTLLMAHEGALIS